MELKNAFFDPARNTFPQNFAVAVSGRGSNLGALIQKLDPKRARIVGVFCSDPDMEAIRVAEKAGIAVHVPDTAFHRKPIQERDDEMKSILKNWSTQWIALAGYRRLIGESLLNAFPWRVLNIHPSLLPAFKGQGAVAQALAYGVTVAGATVHFVDNAIDNGSIIRQAHVNVQPGDTEETLAARILKQEHELYAQSIHQLLNEGFCIKKRRVHPFSQSLFLSE